MFLQILGPLFVRLAWHASGTYDVSDSTGGSVGGRIRFSPEFTDNANKGLHIAIEIMEKLHKKHPTCSYADLYTFGGVVTIEALGGPVVAWAPGRHDVDETSNAKCPVANGRLPDAAQGAQHLRMVFNRMGFNDREIVALSGAHCLGRCHTDRSGFDGKWTYTPTRFSNQYYKLLLGLKWKKVKLPSGIEQFINEDVELIMMLPSDIALIEDPKFKAIVEEYAHDKDIFYKDFALAFAKLLNLGVKTLPKSRAPGIDEQARSKL